MREERSGHRLRLFPVEGRAAIFLFLTPAGYYRPWISDAGNRQVMQRIAATGATSPVIAAEPVTAVYGLEFYRRKPAYQNWPPIREFDGSTAAKFVVLGVDGPPSTPPGTHPIWRHPVAGIVLFGR